MSQTKAKRTSPLGGGSRRSNFPRFLREIEVQWKKDIDAGLRHPTLPDRPRRRLVNGTFTPWQDPRDIQKSLT